MPCSGGDHATALDLHKRLLRLWNVLTGDNLPANVKFAMELQGRGGLPRAPMTVSAETQRAAIQGALSSMGLLGG